MAFSPPLTSPLSPPTPHQNLIPCKSMRDLKQIHSLVLKSPSLQTPLIFSKLLSFSALNPHGDVSYALHLLAHIETPTTSMHNVVIRGLSLCRKIPTSSSMLVYQALLQCSLSPNNFTFPSLIKVLAECGYLRGGRLVHAHVVKLGFESDCYVRNNLIRLYTVCGEMGIAHKLFDRFPDRDLVSWTTLILGYSKTGRAEEAVSLFLEMTDDGVKPDAIIMATVISACSKVGDMHLCRKLHNYIDAYNVEFDVVTGNALVDMYAKCGDIKLAYSIFKEMNEKDVVSWNSMISGLAQNGEFKEGLKLFRRMQCEGIEPDGMTLVAVLNSCANLGSLEMGNWVRVYMDKVCIKANGIIGNALVDMYAKCGRIDQAMELFNKMTKKDLYTYTTMILGLAMHGQAKEALDLFSELSKARIRPNSITFVGVLSACSHAGLVNKGLAHFHDISRVYGINPKIEHYGCVVAMLGRAGLLNEAQEFINRMPIEPDAFIWGTLLGACKVHGNVKLGESAAKNLLKLQPNEDGAYVLMSNMYASDNQKRHERNMRKLMKVKKVKKTPGCSLIEVDGMVHEFRVRDKSHPRRREIYMAVKEIDGHLRSEGYRPAMKILEQELCWHSLHEVCVYVS